MKMNITTLSCVLWLATMPATSIAQDASGEHQVVFRFVGGKDMFYIPWNGNGARLDSLCSMLVPSMLEPGSVKVDGYGNDRKIVKARCNRVKTELILRRGLTEDHFLTTNRTGSFNGLNNVVVVTLPSMKAKEQSEQQIVAAKETDERLAAERAEQERKAAEAKRKAEADRLAKEQETKQVNQQENGVGTPSEPQPSTGYHFALRANMLRWATLTPDLGIEWRINRHVGIAVNGSWTSWSWDDKNRRYAMWEVTPEVRYYIGKEKRGYVGAMYKAGEFNYKLSAAGKQGDLMGGGITGGYQLKLNKALSIDFSLGLGYVRADYEKYTVIDGVRVRDGKETKNWWGPVNAGATLVWTIF